MLNLDCKPVNSEVYVLHFCCSFPSVEAFPQENPPLLRNPSSTPGPRVPPLQSGPQLLGHHSSSTSPSERPSAQKPTAAQSQDSHSPLRGTRTYSRIYKNINSKPAAFRPLISAVGVSTFVWWLYIVLALQHDKFMCRTVTCYFLLECVLLLLTDCCVCFLSHRERM